jgi:hypothetical protein
MSHYRRRRYHSAFRGVVVAAAIVFAFSCSGGSGCSGCGIKPIPGGFAPTKRNANAGQVRVTSSALATIESNPAQLLGGLLGSGTGGSNGVIAYPIVSCGSTDVCCSNNMALPNCGPIDIDLTLHAGDQPRLQLVPNASIASPNGELDVTVRARVKTAMPLIVSLEGANCVLTLDTTQGSSQDLVITAPVALDQDATAGTTKLALGAAGIAVTGLESADYSITPQTASDVLCYVADIVPASTIEGFLGTPLSSAIGGALGATCKSCAALGDCAPFGTACTGGVCMEGSACEQEVGLDGLLPASGLFASFSPTTTGAMELYEVAGGYSLTSEAGGISLGLLGGMEPGGSARDMCGPPATEPAQVSVPRSTYFEGNTRPDNGSAFDIGIGLHKSQLAQLAYAGYEGGIFCLTISHNTVSELDTDTIGLLSRSLTKLVESNSPMAIGLRPQSPPTITLGPNTFTTNGSGDSVLSAPLLDVKFSQLELDFFAEVDLQYIRVFTVVADVDLPIGMQINAGSLEPVLGDTTNAFTNISVKNSQAVTESPATLASLFPTLLGLVLPQLASALPTVNLPSIEGLGLSVSAVTAVDDLDGDGVGDFLAIFANVSLAANPGAQPVHTTVDIANVDEPDQTIAHDSTKWAGAVPPRVTLSLGAVGQDPSRLEFSLRLDHGFWTPWSTNANPTLSPQTFWLPGIHAIEVRSRLRGVPASEAIAPVKISVPIGIGILPPRGVDGELKLTAAANDPSQGCACNSSGTNFGAAAPFAVIFALLLLPLRALRRSIKRLGAIVWLTALACLPGCSCGSKNPCGSAACMTGTLTGAVGRWTSIAGDNQRVMVATYDNVFGDLVIGDATDMTNIKYTTIDGVPDETPTYDPGTWRGGVSDPGPNVGAWTSIVLSNGTARTAYQDRDNGVLKYAYETTAGGSWNNFVVDPGMGSGDMAPKIGEMARMITDGGAFPTIAYLAVGVDDGMGHKLTELRLARATTMDPQSASDFTITTVASAVGSCAGICDATDSCIAGSDGDVCITPTSDCSAACGSGDVCSNGACVAALPDPMIYDIPTGTGVFPSPVLLSDGRLAITYYDQTAKTLDIGVETSLSSSMFMPTVLDGGGSGVDRGMWSSAAVASDGTVHVAYQDAIGNQVMYTTWKGGTPGTPDVVDDGERTGDRPHIVGAAATMFLVNDSPNIAYQDGLASDVDVSTMASAGAWTMMDIASTDLLDGFFIAVTTGHGSPVIAWDERDPTNPDIHSLVVQAP